MRYYAVIDTNVLVSAMLKMKSIPWQVMAESLTGQIIPLLNDEILKEYKNVLSRPKFRFSEAAINALLEGVTKRGIYIDAAFSDDIGNIIPDPKDFVFYEVVMEAGKQQEAYLVTGNLKHFPVSAYVVTPREMLEIIGIRPEENRIL